MQRGGTLPENGPNWATELGLSMDEFARLNPCVPGEFTMPGACYLNSGSPRVVYEGSAEGTLPLVAGRWYLVPEHILLRHLDLMRDAVRVSSASRLVR